MPRRTLAAAAVAVSAIGVAMAAASAAQRAGTGLDLVLMGALSVAITLGAHLLPSVVPGHAPAPRRAAAWALWAACMAITVYSHGAYFSAAAQRAGSSRAAAVPASQHTQALRDQLASIHARPLATVAADLATAQGQHTSSRLQLQRCEQASPGRCAARTAAVAQAQQHMQALQTEHSQATHADSLRERLATAAEQHDQLRSAAAADPVAALIAGSTGSAQATVTAIGIASAVVLELLAALLWAECLQLAPAATAEAPIAVQPAQRTQARVVGIEPARSPAGAPYVVPTSAAERHSRRTWPRWPGGNAPPRAA
ncbi:MAG: hypothetical protein AB9M53_00550 [Leptothrix sp. (in: b-proteobacteria)]